MSDSSIFSWLIIGCLSVFTLSGCNQETEVTTPRDELSEAEEYLLSVALGSEFGSSSRLVRKWVRDVQVFLSDTVDQALREEYERIRQEINGLSNDIQITNASQPEEADFVILLSDADRYAAFEPNAANLVSNNFGLFWVYWNGRSEITRGSMYVDVERTPGLDCQKHLLREELTQALGLMNDTNDYPASIFYQAWTCTPSYAKIDRELLQIFLDPRVEPGMNRAELEEILLQF